MPLLAHFEDLSPNADRRGSPRRALQFDVGGAPVHAAEVKIHDLSLSGALLETSITLREGDTFSVELPQAGGVEAIVVWNSGEFYGCHFKTPIPPAALSAALLQSSPRPPGEVSAVPVDPVAELRLLNAQVERLAHKVEEAIQRLSGNTNGGSK